ncbi:DUF4440 domain-containing protein [Psychromonas hadalis]|uniref:nuclear transport factor 2 family protein n=1 Tax=Psychromonas hadalis TaxID=211669 RepID=UPI0003B572EE|nr:DUF4440 domain-containing protein [Psychromonas hadalis]
MDIIIKQEIDLHQIWFRNNKSVVKRLLHPEFREVEESGRSYNFNEIVSLTDNEKHSEDRVHSQDYECINLEKNVILLLYKSALLKPSGEYGSFTKRSSIWVKSDSQWQMKYHQGTSCKAFKINI